jgi:hypothetical protein
VGCRGEGGPGYLLPRAARLALSILRLASIFRLASILRLGILGLAGAGRGGRGVLCEPALTLEGSSKIRIKVLQLFVEI